MKLEDIKKEDTIATIKLLVKKAGFTPSKVKHTVINNLYDEYVVDVDENVKDMTDRQFSQIAQSKSFRALIKKHFGEENLRDKSVVGMVAYGGSNVTGRFVFQVKTHKS